MTSAAAQLSYSSLPFSCDDFQDSRRSLEIKTMTEWVMRLHLWWRVKTRGNERHRMHRHINAFSEKRRTSYNVADVTCRANAVFNLWPFLRKNFFLSFSVHTTFQSVIFSCEHFLQQSIWKRSTSSSWQQWILCRGSTEEWIGLSQECHTQCVENTIDDASDTVPVVVTGL